MLTSSRRERPSTLASTPEWINAMNTGERERVERRLTAILAADVAGYSRLMGADEEGTLAALKAIRRQLADPKITEHRGRIVKTTGDGMLVEFHSIVDAVRCAVELQHAMAEHNCEVPASERIEFRIGINLGDIIIDDGDIFGDGVNIAARLEALAEPGGICVSRVVRDQVRDKLDFTFEDLGEQLVKNIARPVRATEWSRRSSPRSPASARSSSSPAIRASPTRAKTSM
jgi:class 3 adenylate cyclase